MSDETKPFDLPADDETPAEQATLTPEASADEAPAADSTDAPAQTDATGPFAAPSSDELADATPPSETEGEQPEVPAAESEPAADAFDFSAADEGSDDAAAEASDEQQAAPAQDEDEPAADGEQSAEGKDTPEDAGEQAFPAITPQPTLEESAAMHPLQAQVVDESMPAHDAVPAEAAADLAKLRLSNDAVGSAEDPAPLPAGAPQAGTMEDATGLSGDMVSPQVASGMAEAKPADEALHDVLSDEPKADEGEGEGGEPEAEEGGEDEAEDEAEGDDAASNEADAGDFVDESEGEPEPDGEDAIFGDAQMKHMELADIVGDGLDHVRASAEAAQKAQMAMLQTPMSVLSLEHKDLMTRMRSVLSEVIHLADAIFHRN